MSLSTSPSPIRAAIYARISRDRAGAGLGVERQETDCRALAERLGWDVQGVYVDNDISAYSGKPRPQYREMLDAVREGRVTGIIAWHPDRLHRRTTELESFIALCDATGVEVRTVTAGDLDLGTPTGRMTAKIVGAVAQKEAEQTKERVRAAKKQAAAAGKYRGGPRPYGYDADGVTVREDEAQIVREATTAVLAGRSLAAVAKDLSARGLTTSTGKPWTYNRLRDVLVRPRNAGKVAKGRADRGEHEIVAEEATWPAIVDEDAWRAVHGLLTDPARRSRQQGNATAWLGSGIYRCGRCGAVMRPAPFGGTPKSNRRTRKYLYRCTESAHLTVNATETDEHVRGVVADLVRDPRVVAAMYPHDDERLAADRERRTALLTRLEQFTNDYAAGLITGTQLAKVTASVTAQIGEVEARLAEATRRSTSSPIVNAVDPGEAFLNAPVDVQRAVLSSVLTVEVLPAERRGGSWSADRLRLSPVGEGVGEVA